MRGIKILLGTTALLAGLALAPAAQAQIVIDLGVPPSCAYGYYGYAPYACAPYGYYGPGYFYNGIFLGIGPWGGWGYSHGWGSHRFVNDGGGRYRGGPGRVAYHASSARPSVSHASVTRTTASRTRTSASRPSRATASHATALHASASHAAPSGGGSRGGGSRGGGGGSRGGGGDKH